VQAGGWLRAVGREVGVLRLTEVMRQRDPGERRALAALHDLVPDRYLDWRRAGRIETFDGRAGAREPQSPSGLPRPVRLVSRRR